MHLRTVAISTLAVLATQNLIHNASAAAQTPATLTSEIVNPHKTTTHQEIEPNTPFETRISRTRAADSLKYTQTSQSQADWETQPQNLALPLQNNQDTTPASENASQTTDVQIDSLDVYRIPPPEELPPAAVTSQLPNAAPSQDSNDSTNKATKAGRIKVRLDSLRSNRQAYRSKAGELPPLSAPENYLPQSPVLFQGYNWPAQGVLSSGYGWRWGRMHKGIDIAGPIGTPIFAAAAGVVTYAGWDDGGYGNLVEIQHPNGSLTRYAHNDRIWVRQGQQVEQGQQISDMGSTGNSTGPHCHFELHTPGQGAVDPIAYLPRERADNPAQTNITQRW